MRGLPVHAFAGIQDETETDLDQLEGFLKGFSMTWSQMLRDFFRLLEGFTWAEVQPESVHARAAGHLCRGDDP